AGLAVRSVFVKVLCLSVFIISHTGESGKAFRARFTFCSVAPNTECKPALARIVGHKKAREIGRLWRRRRAAIRSLRRANLTSPSSLVPPEKDPPISPPARACGGTQPGRQRFRLPAPRFGGQ